MFVVSDKGNPNSLSDSKGQYRFDYNQIFNGDSVVKQYENGYNYKLYLTNTVNILFEKEGYFPKIIQKTLYPNFILDQDVVLIGVK